MGIQNLIISALREPKEAIFYSLSSELAREFPKRAVLETDHNWAFHVPTFANQNQCELRGREDVHSQWDLNWHMHTEQLGLSPFNVWCRVHWEGHEMELVMVGVQGAHCRDIRCFIVADNEAIGKAFITAVCRWCTQLRSEVLVFNDGHWFKSEELFQSIKSSSLDNLILPGTLAEDIASDFRQFFDSRDTYERYRIPWKRGVLFLGPPGNGKTHMVKALVNMLAVSSLYVRGFKSQYDTDHRNMGEVFKRARDSAPCVLVLEDLDSLVDGSNRSYFLNEMDGFYANEGILCLATTNHPERLDPAILDRPSRFDRKYTFALPARGERKRYLSMFNRNLEESLRLSVPAIKEIADDTEEFSYAYLKELFLSSMMKWMSTHGAVMDQVMVGQIETLRDQMKTVSDIPIPAVGEEDDDDED